LQSHAALERHNFGDGAVFNGAQLFGRDGFALEEGFSGLQEVGRTQEAADMVGAKRWCSAKAQEITPNSNAGQAPWLQAG
jgi:hypothetical protein